MNGTIFETNLITSGFLLARKSLDQTTRITALLVKSIMHKRTDYTALKDAGKEFEDCPSSESDPAYCFAHFIRPLLAELFGVMFFVFVGVTCLSPTATGTSRISTALAHAFILFVMVAATAEVRY